MKSQLSKTEAAVGTWNWNLKLWLWLEKKQILGGAFNTENKKMRTNPTNIYIYLVGQK